MNSGKGFPKRVTELKVSTCRRPPVRYVTASKLKVTNHAQGAAPPDLFTLSCINFRVSDDNYYIPDLAVVPKSRALRVGLMFSPSDMLLAGEVAGPSTRLQDRSLKALAYARARVPTYWRIEPDEGPILNGDSYDPPTAYKAGTVATLTKPFPVSFDPATLLE